MHAVYAFEMCPSGRLFFINTRQVLMMWHLYPVSMSNTVTRQGCESKTEYHLIALTRTDTLISRLGHLLPPNISRTSKPKAQ